MSVNAYLMFNGNCREAVEFYAKVFNTEKPHIMTVGDAPPNPEQHLPEEAKNLVMHARLTISGSMVMFSDMCNGGSIIEGNNVTLTVLMDNMDELKTAFSALQEGGKVGMDIQETFWSKCYGSLTDKYGVHWQLSME